MRVDSFVECRLVVVVVMVLVFLCIVCVMGKFCDRGRYEYGVVYILVQIRTYTPYTYALYMQTFRALWFFPPICTTKTTH